MRIPNGMSEEDVVDTIYRVVNTLAARFRFGYHSTDDMKQEGARFAIEALNSGAYDPTRPLENFLYTHIRNRFINYKRDNYVRNEPPCHYEPGSGSCSCKLFGDMNECKKLTDWRARNLAKQSLMRPVDVSVISDDAIKEDSQTFENVSFNEIKQLIDSRLPADLRADYLRMAGGIQIPKARKNRVREAILLIWREAYEGEVEGEG